MAAQQAFQTCHVNLTQNAALDRAAADLLQGYAPDPALARQAYRSTMRRTFRASNYGDLARLGGMLAGRCGFWDGFREYGVATTSGNVAVIVANPDAVDAAQFGTFNRRLLDLTNAARAQGQKCGEKLMNSIGPLSWDPLLATSAAAYVQDMVQLNFRGHISAKDQSDPTARAVRAGFVGKAGENAVYDVVTPEEAMAGLLASPEHCLNLMNPAFTRFGSAIANAPFTNAFGTYWVQDFGIPGN